MRTETNVATKHALFVRSLSRTRAAALQRGIARLHCAPVGRARNKEKAMNEQIQPPKGAPLFNPWSPEFIANPYPSLSGVARVSVWAR